MLHLTKLTNIPLLSGILSIVFVFIVISTILFYCKVLKPKRKSESINNPQMSEMITPELIIPVLTEEIVASENVTLEAFAPEIITPEEEAPQLLEIKENAPITVILLNIDSSNIEKINIEMKQ